MIDETIRLIENDGCFLELQQGRLKIKGGKKLDSSLLAIIQENKSSFVESLRYNQRGGQAGFMVALHGELYMQTTSKRTVVFLEKLEDEWELRKETYEPEREKAVFVKTLQRGSFSQVIRRADSYLNYIKEVSA